VRSGDGSASAAIAAGPVADELRAALDARGWRWCETTSMDVHALPDPDVTAIAWLPARLRLDAALASTVENFWKDAGRSPRVAVTELRFDSGSVRVPLGSAVVLATPAAARLSGAGLVARSGVMRIRLAEPWHVDLPDSIGAHLRAINAESTVQAELARALGERPSWRSLAVEPFVVGLRGWLRAEGQRREALTPAIVEGYRHAAAAAKLWELLYASEPSP